MNKRQQLRRKSIQNRHTSVLAPLPLSDLDQYLQELAAQRTGGVTNLRGMSYQLLYVCYRLLSDLDVEGKTAIQLEGLEDLDVHNTIVLGEADYIQLKTSINSIDAGTFWNLGVLQNFYAVHREAPKATFRLVYNMPVAFGHLQQLIAGELSINSLNHWVQKLRTLSPNFDSTKAKAFLSQVSFEYITEAEIKSRCLSALLSGFDVHANSEEQYLKAIFYHAFEWSRKRAVITYHEVGQVIQSVKDSYSKAPINDAVRHNWLEKVVYAAEGESNAEGYFDGQSARPRHIALQLPVRRLHWESRIEQALQSSAVVAIKSSSGQGKSTLAWQVGYNLSHAGRSIYQLRQCSRAEEVNAAVEHLRAWAAVGTLPLVVVDGLTQQVAQWAVLAERVADLPVKFLVTTREEDWYRYEANQATVPVQVVDVTLSRSEAEHLYAELQKRGKVSPHITRWQPAWETVSDKGLLIEYVYLLTQGQMLEDRLGQQVKALNREPVDAAAKLEILRLVAVADCLGIRLKTSRLVRHVQETVRFNSDYGEVLNQLTREYYLRFGEQQVEGLHPVRSQHLVKLLHTMVPLDYTLLNVFRLLAPEDTYDFFIGAAGMLQEAGKPEFYQQVAEQLATGPFQDMSAALDGLLCGTALRYWQDNKPVFDAVAETGGLELFMFHALPFTKLDTLEQLSKMESLPQEGIQRLLIQSRQLPPISFVSSDLMELATLLHTHLRSKQRFASYSGVGSLAEWLYRVGIPLPGLVRPSEEYLLAELRSKSLPDVEELIRYLWIEDATFCRAFVTKHKEELMGLLKVKTNTPTLYEDANELYVEYLLDLAEADKANALSVSRLVTFCAIFPEYTRYHVKAAVVPLLPEHILEVTLINARKRMTQETLARPREARLNRIWADTILNNYRSFSVYEWQERLVVLRREALDLAKRFVRFLEIKLELNTSRNNAAIEAVVTQSELVEKLRAARPKLSEKTHGTASAEEKLVEKPINDWLSSLRNFTGQFAGLVNPKTSNSRNLATININDTVQRLPAMQAAYHAIVGQHSYFDLSALEPDEVAWFQRLYESVQFFIAHHVQSSSERIYNAKDRIRRWAAEDEMSRLTGLYRVLQSFETVSPVRFHLPTHIGQDGPLRQVVVGVEGINFGDPNELTALLIGMADLGKLEIDFVTLLPIKDNHASIGLRYSKAFFNRVIASTHGTEEEEELEFPLPLPVIPDLQTVAPLAGVTLKLEKHQEEGTIVAQMMQDLWALGEYKRRLNSSAAAEQQWLRQLEKETRISTTSKLQYIKSKLTVSAFNQLSKYVTEGLDSPGSLEESELQLTIKEVLENGFTA